MCIRDSRAAAAKRGQTPTRRLPRPRQRVLTVEAGERLVDDARGDAPRAKLGPQTRGPVAARHARAHPVAGIASVVEVSARGQVRHDVGGDVGRRTATLEARGELGARPRAAREKVARREAGGLGVENLAWPYDFSGAGTRRPSVSRILASRS